MLNEWLFKRIDNSSLVVFRVIFGLLITIEAWGAIASGWIRRTFIEPKFTFNFIGFDFLQPLPGNGMLWYYGVMGLFGILVMLGYKYRLAIFGYGIMWTSVYLMQKSSYNNHYYLLMLLCFIFFFLPAHKHFSIDAWRNKSFRSVSMPRWVWLVIVGQLLIVFSYAAVAKVYPDWLDGRFPALLMSGKRDYLLVGDFLQQPWIRYGIGYFGLFFDLLIIPALLWKKTRIPAFLAAIFFHLFNSFIFHIGIFPYLSLAFTIFFFPAKKINKWFLFGRKPIYEGEEVRVPSYRKVLLLCLAGWFLIQLALPIRHWFFEGNVLWTEEGHRLSWRMMLRSKSGKSTFRVVEKGSRDTLVINNEDYLTQKQLRAMNSKPDMLWQFAQRLKDQYAQKGKAVEVYVDSRVSVNGRPPKPLIDPRVDLAAEKWDHLEHHDWILPAQLD